MEKADIPAALILVALIFLAVLLSPGGCSCRVHIDSRPIDISAVNSKEN